MQLTAVRTPHPAATERPASELIHSNKIAPLTSLRFVAAALIVLHHTRGYFGVGSDFLEPTTLDHAVAFFFVLSGFILSYVYPSFEQVSRRRFLQARFARLWPAHVFALVLFCVLFPQVWEDVSQRPRVVLATITMTQAWIPRADFSTALNGVSWSISTEFGFYLLFLVLNTRWASTWHWKLLTVVLVLLAATHVSDVLSVPAGDAPALHTMTALDLFYRHPLGRMLEFVCGMTLVLVWRRLAPVVRLNVAMGTLLELVALGVAGLGMLKTPDWYAALVQDGWVGTGLSIWVAHGGLSIPGFCVLILVMALQRGWISRMLSHPIPVLLGEISFSIYLLHQMLIVYYGDHARGLQWLPNGVAYALFWILLLSLAHLVWQVVERPVRKTILSLGSHQQRQPWHFGLLRSRLVWAEASVVVLVGGGAVFAIFHHPSFEPVPTAYPQAAYADDIADAHDVIFGGKFALRRAAVHPTQTGLLLELVWESLVPQILEQTVAVHPIDDAGNILGRQGDYPFDLARTRVAAGTTWRDEVSIRNADLAQAQALGIGIYGAPDQNLLLVEQGPADRSSHRLVLSIPIWDGTLVKGSGAAIFQLKDGQKHGFSSFEAYLAAGGRRDLSNVRTLSAERLDAYPTGAKIGGT